MNGKVEAMAHVIYGAFKAGHKLMICGNGGSSSQADHLAAEFLVRFRHNRAPLPAMSLNMDPATMTACANDLGYQLLFGRMVEAFGRKGDVLLTISTSGKSENCYIAETTAKGLGVVTLGMLGPKEGCVQRPDLAFHTVGDTAAIQEHHMKACHELAGLVEALVIEGT